MFIFGKSEKIRNIKGKIIKMNINDDVNKLRLVNIKDYIPDAFVSLKYAKRNRISKKRLYKKNICLVNKRLAQKLKRIDNRLKRKYKKRLKFWDCYRPWSIQKRRWHRFHNKRYIDHPTKASKHNRGLSVDVTLVDLKGHELKMPTKYDHFSKKSWHKYKRLNKKIKKNRYILRNIMIKYGLSYSKSKWWHYSLKTRKRYPISNFTISDYAKKLEKEKRDKIFKNNNKKNRDVTSVSFRKNKIDSNRNIDLEIKQKISSIKPKIINCFINENNRGIELPNEVTITYTVRKDGRFYNVTIQHSKYKNKKDELNYCILKAFREIKIKRIPMLRLGKIPLEFSIE
jgi:D-alanyl-D-alanine dipeptidase